jgi:hypothetical protein
MNTRIMNAVDLRAALEGIGLTDTGLRYVDSLAQDADQIYVEAVKHHTVCDMAADVDRIQVYVAKGIDGDVPNLRIRAFARLVPGKAGWKLDAGHAVLEASDRHLAAGDGKASSPWATLKTRGVMYTCGDLSEWFVPRYAELVAALAVLEAERTEHDAAHQAWTEAWRARWEAAGGR